MKHAEILQTCDLGDLFLTKLCTSAQAHCRKKGIQLSVGIISPYSGQVELLRGMARGCGLLSEKGGASGAKHGATPGGGAVAEVRTVDGFQVLRSEFRSEFIAPLTALVALNIVF